MTQNKERETQREREREEVPAFFARSCYVTRGVFSKDECEKLLERMNMDLSPTAIDTLEDNVRRVVSKTSLKVWDRKIKKEKNRKKLKK